MGHLGLGDSPGGCHFELTLTNVPCFLWKKEFIHSFHSNHQTELERTLDVIQANPLIFQRRNQRLEAIKAAAPGRHPTAMPGLHHSATGGSLLGL